MSPKTPRYKYPPTGFCFFADHVDSSSTRTSPARSYFSTRKSTSEDGASGSSRNRETQSETRENTSSNNNYLNGNVKRSRDYSSNLAPSSSTLSKYRTDRSTLTNGSSTVSRSKYSSEREEVPKISERIRNFQPSKSVVEAPTFKSRFLRSSQDTPASKAADDAEEARPSVSDLRRRYDQNRNHVTPERSRTPGATAASTVSTKPPIQGSKSTGRTSYGSDSDDSVERDDRSTPVNQRLASVAPTVRVQNSPDRITNGAASSRPSVPKEIPRSSSPSTLSSSSSDDNQVMQTTDGVAIGLLGLICGRFSDRIRPVALATGFFILKLKPPSPGSRQPSFDGCPRTFTSRLFKRVIRRDPILYLSGSRRLRADYSGRHTTSRVSPLPLIPF